MHSKFWEVIRDDSKRTFEVLGREANTNHFTNSVHGMQKAGMTVTGMTLPVGPTYSTKEGIKITGYVAEAGLYERLTKEYNKINHESFDAE